MIAQQWGCGTVVTTDDRQIQAAKAVGLTVVDLRQGQRSR